MLDKSIPYKNIYMIRGPVKNAADPVLPDGYSLRMFAPGDRDAWCAVETSVAEFPDIEKARAYFEKDYAPFADELPRRCVFACAPDGTQVATATAWWSKDGDERLAMVHWVSVHPEHQGKGLGRAVMARVLQLFETLEPGRPIMLHTQTWSHIAVRMYLSLGFRPLADVSPIAPRSELPDAIEVLRSVMSEEELRRFADCAVCAADYLQ
ncbi:MAG: GNAT family N-acetyltransferase [Ruminococcaceae bacterium]|nr:GNAT family N-acetyltransferase [Oscillospiraceae bacterium]